MRPAVRAAVLVVCLSLWVPSSAQTSESAVEPPDVQGDSWTVPSEAELRERVKGLFLSGRSIAAMDEVSGALLRDPSSPVSYELASELYQAFGENETAIDFFRSLTLQYPRQSRAFHYLGLHEGLVNRFDDALAAYDVAVELDPENAETRFRRAGIYHVQARFEEALAELRVARRLDPGSAKIAALLARSLRIDDDYEGAAAVLEESLSLHPDEPELHYGLAQVRSRQDRSDEAEAALRKAVELDPDYVEALRDLGRLLLQSGREDEADTHLVRADWIEEMQQLAGHLRDGMRRRPNDAAYPLLLAELRLVENDVDEAASLLQRAAEQGARSARVLAAVAWVKLYKGDVAGARSDLGRFGNRADPYVDLTRAAWLFAVRQPQPALSFLRRATENGPQDRAFLMRAANLCRFGGAREEARELLRRAAAAPMPALPGR